ncbi:MAG: heme-binding protein [Polyangiaceae bacterium]|nr:heme-binding protein [Polyangiaceae bacterium]
MAVVAFALELISMAAVKEPTYSVIQRDGAFELREYGPRVVAETRVDLDWDDAGSEGFRRLAGYIFGKNKGRAKIAMTAPVGQRTAPAGGAKIAMTAPVAQRRAGSAWTVAFTMPEGETLGTLPEPEDSRVVLRALPKVRVAVVRFRGRWTAENMNERTEALRAWAAVRGVAVSGDAEVNRYDPPWIPWFLRRNEIWLTAESGAPQP